MIGDQRHKSTLSPIPIGSVFVLVVLDKSSITVEPPSASNHALFYNKPTFGRLVVYLDSSA
jgi:hypothetical protein